MLDLYQFYIFQNNIMDKFGWKFHSFLTNYSKMSLIIVKFLQSRIFNFGPIAVITSAANDDLIATIINIFIDVYLTLNIW